MIGASSRIESGRNVYGIRLHTGYGRNNTLPDLIQYHKEQTVVFLMGNVNAFSYTYYHYYIQYRGNIKQLTTNQIEIAQKSWLESKLSLRV